MIIPTCNISIGDLTFEFVNDVVIDSSWKNLTDTATIKLPSNILLKSESDRTRSRHILLNYITAGMRVVISLSANQELEEVYKGYIRSIRPSIPIQLECEDEMYQLKRNNIVDAGNSLTLAKLVKKYLSSYQVKHVDMTLGDFQIDNLSTAQLLSELQNQFKLYSFFRGEILVIGLPYDSETSQEHSFLLEGEIIKDQLEYKRAEDVKVSVTAISNNSDGTKTEVEVGDKDGDVRSLNFYNISNGSELKATAERELNRFKYDGYRGGFDAFSLKTVNHGDIINLVHPEESQKSGRYYVDAVKRMFGLNGYRQNITLGARA